MRHLCAGPIVSRGGISDVTSVAQVDHDWAVNQRVRWYRSPLPIARLRELSRRSNLRPFLFATGYLALLAATGTGVFLVHLHLSWPWLLLALFVHGTVHRTLQHSRHELAHRTVFRSRLLNESFLRICNFLCWSSPEYFRASHVRHHQYTVHDELDLEVRLPRVFRPVQWLTQLVLAVPNMIAEIGHLVRWSRGRLAGSGPSVAAETNGALGHANGGAGSSVWEERCFADPPAGQGNADKRAALFRWARIVVFGHLALAIVFIALDLWIMLLIVTFARWLAPWLSNLFIETQHAGLSSNTPDFRLCCRTVEFGPVFRFLYWHMNYHIEHHQTSVAVLQPGQAPKAIERTCRAPLPGCSVPGRRCSQSSTASARNQASCSCPSSPPPRLPDPASSDRPRTDEAPPTAGPLSVP